MKLLTRVYRLRHLRMLSLPTKIKRKRLQMKIKNYCLVMQTSHKFKCLKWRDKFVKRNIRKLRLTNCWLTS
jgi:hypothetical protein